jgi:hypothetical protein
MSTCETLAAVKIPTMPVCNFARRIKLNY